MLWSRDSIFSSPICVLDMDSPDAEAVPLLQRMVALSGAFHENKLDAMRAALSDREVEIRNLAVEYLTSAGMRDPEVRLFVFDHFAPIALDTNSPLRMEALESIKSAYDSFSKESAVNYQILSFIADRMGDPDPMIRSIAVQCLHSKLFGGGKNRPEFARIVIADRASIIRQLRKDIGSDQEFADQAKRVLGLLISGRHDK
jgi:hypothetical protein